MNSEYIEQPPTKDSRRQSQERTEHNDIIQSEITDDTHVQMGVCTVVNLLYHQSRLGTVDVGTDLTLWHWAVLDIILHGLIQSRHYVASV